MSNINWNNLFQRCLSYIDRLNLPKRFSSEYRIVNGFACASSGGLNLPHLMHILMLFRQYNVYKVTNSHKKRIIAQYIKDCYISWKNGETHSQKQNKKRRKHKKRRPRVFMRKPKIGLRVAMTFEKIVLYITQASSCDSLRNFNVEINYYVNHYTPTFKDAVRFSNELNRIGIKLRDGKNPLDQDKREYISMIQREMYTIIKNRYDLV
jgi:hypothetical protein